MVFFQGFLPFLQTALAIFIIFDVILEDTGPYHLSFISSMKRNILEYRGVSFRFLIRAFGFFSGIALRNFPIFCMIAKIGALFELDCFYEKS